MTKKTNGGPEATAGANDMSRTTATSGTEDGIVDAAAVETGAAVEDGSVDGGSVDAVGSAAAQPAASGAEAARAAREAAAGTSPGASASHHDPTTESWVVRNVEQLLDDDLEVVLERACGLAGITPSAVRQWSLVRRSIDARGQREPRFVLSVRLDVAAGTITSVPEGGRVGRFTPPERAPVRTLRATQARPVIVGYGPCGLFAALHLALAGLRPIVIERGRPVETRAKDVARLFGRGEIDEDSNLCFGEGGAGTWSDGKLYTRVSSPWIDHILRQLVSFGAPERILVDARPHLGTDRLVRILKAGRAALLELGGEILFETAVERLETDRHGAVTGVRLRDGERVDATHVILALGHSARDLYERLAHDGVLMTPKAFAVGFRVEHPQALIDEIQYGRWAQHSALPAAYYELTANLTHQGQQRGIYSFCMCPGGSVVATPTREGEVCVNGMSHAARSGRYANSALVVTVAPSDCAGHARGDGPVEALLAGMRFQQDVEAQAWTLGGGGFVAPAQRLVDYVGGRPSRDVRRTTYKRGVTAAPLRGLYPEAVTDSLSEAARLFDRRMRGFMSDDAVLIGVETRTSAPVTIVRDRETLQSPSHPGLYPAGEGAGYSGGIMSAAIDGLRVAERLLASLG